MNQNSGNRNRNQKEETEKVKSKKKILIDVMASIMSSQVRIKSPSLRIVTAEWTYGMKNRGWWLNAKYVTCQLS